MRSGRKFHACHLTTIVPLVGPYSSERYLSRALQGRDVYGQVILPRVRAVVVETLRCVREGLEMKGRAIEWLGFDLMVTDDLRVMLLEVNVSPDVSHRCDPSPTILPVA